MGLYVVKEQAGVDGLLSALLRARVSRSARETAIAKLRRANPGLDLDDLRPGTIVAVPPLEGERSKRAAPDQDAADAVVASVNATLDALPAEAERTLEERKAQFAQARQVVSSTAVKRVARKDPELRETIAAWQKAAEQDLEDARTASEAVASTVAEWQEELAELRKHFE
jgi:hypothetical protein